MTQEQRSPCLTEVFRPRAAWKMGVTIFVIAYYLYVAVMRWL